MVEREILPKSGRIRGIELKAGDLCRVIVRDGKPVGLMVNGVEKLFEEDGPQHLDIMAEIERLNSVGQSL